MPNLPAASGIFVRLSAGLQALLLHIYMYIINLKYIFSIIQNLGMEFDRLRALKLWWWVFSGVAEKCSAATAAFL